MYNFWDNIYKFPRFLIAVLIGFFLTTFQPVFKSLKKTKWKIIITIVGIIILVITYQILKLMTE